jgi:hypothetical protein
LISQLTETDAPAPNAYSRLQALEWLVGNWENKAGDLTVDTKIDWAGDKNFLIRKFKVKGSDQNETDGWEIIGWDPEHQQIRSWIFDSNGGFGGSTWANDGEHLLIRASNVLPDGSHSTEVLSFVLKIISRLSPYVLESVHDAVGAGCLQRYYSRYPHGFDAARAISPLKQHQNRRLRAGTIPRARPPGFRGVEHPESRASARRECHNCQRLYRGIEFSFKGPLKIITVTVSVDEIERRARNLWGEAFKDRTSVGTLWLPDGGARMFVARKVKAILFETMRDPFAVASPRGCREVENAVLDTVLSSVLDRSQPEGTRFRQKIARKAEEYLRTCCRDPISISDLCAAVGATRRTLHLGFV